MKYLLSILTAFVMLLLISIILVLVFGSIDKTPYLIKLIVGGGVPLWSAQAVYRYLKAKESKKTTTPPTESSQ